MYGHQYNLYYNQVYDITCNHIHYVELQSMPCTGELITKHDLRLLCCHYVCCLLSVISLFPAFCILHTRHAPPGQVCDGMDCADTSGHARHVCHESLVVVTFSDKKVMEIVIRLLKTWSTPLACA